MKYLFFLILCIFPIEAVAAPYVYPEQVTPEWECLPNAKNVRKITGEFKYSTETYGERSIGKIYQIDLNGDGECEYFVKVWGGRRRASERRVFYDSIGREIADIEGGEGNISYGEKKNGYLQILAQARGERTNSIYTTNVYSYENGKYICEFCTDISHGDYQDLAKKAYEQKDYKLAEIYYWNAHRINSSSSLSDANNLAVAYIKQNKFTEAISVLNQHLARNDDAIIRGESSPCYSGNCEPNESQLKRIKSTAFFNRGLAREKMGLFGEALKDYKIAVSLRASSSAIDAIGRVAALDSQKQSQTENIVLETSSHEKTPVGKGDIVIKGRLFFDGRPLSDYTRADAKLRLYVRKSGELVTPAYEYDPETATFTLHVTTEGRYFCRVDVNADPTNPNSYAGDFKGDSAFFPAWFTSITPLVKVNMGRLIHLVEPQDNAKPIVGWSASCYSKGNKVDFKTPVRFSWEPIGKDVDYTYKVNRVECSPYAYKEMVAGDETKSTSVTLDLPPNSDGEIYSFRITAKKNGRVVGSFMTHGERGRFGGGYPFHVVAGPFEDARKDNKIAESLREAKAPMDKIERAAALDSPKELQTGNIVQETSPPEETYDGKGDIAIKGRLYFDGKPLSDYTRAEAKLLLYVRKLGEWVTPAYEYDPDTAAFTLHVISEGSYSCNARVDADTTNPNLYPGDLEGRASFSAWFKSANPSVMVDMEKFIHLVEPQDNGKPLVGWGASCFGEVNLKTPVRFSWEPIGKDVSYTYKVRRTECSPFAYKEMVAGDKIKATNVALDLPPNRDGEIYSFEITAKKNGKQLGSITTHGENGYGWNYRFRAVK